MNIAGINKIELEITSNCNAACPGCARTIHNNKLTISSISLNDIVRTFPNKTYIEHKKFKFCGVLGDPAHNVECVEMVRYLTSHGGYCELSTNGGIQSELWWEELGKISNQRPGLVHIHFCVDGHEETNHIYRVNTKFSVIDRNMTAYARHAAPESATWIFIVFDHNEYELPKAEDHARRLGFRFATRTGMRNSYHTWVADIKKKQDGRLIQETKQITTTGQKEHSKKEQVIALDQFISDCKNNSVDNIKIKEVVDSIVCKLVHEGEIFIASDMTLWPCCFLWDSYFKNNESIREKLSFEDNWNSLTHHSIEEIIQHPWFEVLLEQSWNPKDSKHLSRCVRTCAKNKAYHNEINYKT
jgi:MoaA/NifB/PqqE/SkfB family radical SAM enzyme